MPIEINCYQEIYLAKFYISYYSEHQIVYMTCQEARGLWGFSGLAGGRRPFRDLSVGEAAAPPQAENAEGAKLPHG